jgi:hypothetical protein
MIHSSRGRGEAEDERLRQREDKIPANGKIRLQESLHRIVQLYQATGQSEKAAEWSKKCRS